VSGGRAYTQRFALLYDDGASSSYTVPPGYRAVGKLITFQTGSSTAENVVLLWVAGVLVAQWRPGANTTTSSALLAVAYSGETLRLTIYGTEIGATLAGYLLTDSTGPLGELTERELPELPSSKPTSDPLLGDGSR